MANIRALKKEIDNQVFAVISDCFAFSELHPGVKEDVVSVIISDAVNLRNELIHRVNHADHNADAKQVKAYFQAVKQDLLAGTDKLFGQLSSVSTKKKK